MDTIVNPNPMYAEKLKEYNNTDPEMKPKLIFWPKHNTYFVSVHFSDAHIKNRGMEVIHG